jgi:hypothetical protein
MVLQLILDIHKYAETQISASWMSLLLFKYTLPTNLYHPPIDHKY